MHMDEEERHYKRGRTERHQQHEDLYAHPHYTSQPSDLPSGGQSVISPKSTYRFCAHMHEILNDFLFTENQEQWLNVGSIGQIEGGRLTGTSRKCRSKGG